MAKATAENKEAKAAETKDAPAGGSQLTGTDDDKMTFPETTEVRASEMSARRGSDKSSKLAASDKTVDSLKAEDAEKKAEEDMSEYGRLSRSGYVLNEDKVTGKRWVGVPYSQDPAERDKDHIVTITPITDVRPWTGLQVRPKDGEPFAVPEVGKDATPSFWLTLQIPGTKNSFIEA